MYYFTVGLEQFKKTKEGIRKGKEIGWELKKWWMNCQEQKKNR